MNEETEENGDFEIPDPASGDAFLRFLVNCVDRENDDAYKGPLVTVILDGIIVSGEIMPIWKWIKFVEGGVPYLSSDQFRIDPADKKIHATYIHLRNVSMRSGELLTRAEIWRGRISQIGGWIPGSER